MFSNVRWIVFILCAAGLWSCNDNLHFSANSAGQKITNSPSTLPPDPDIVPTPIPTPAPIYSKTSGACAADSSTSLTSCLKCNVPPTPPQEPQLSQKAKYLLQIMTTGCAIANGSDPKNYEIPNRDKILTFLNRCSPTAYPDTIASSEQQKVIDDLLNSPAFQQKIFGGLYYHPPYTDRFETFFGLEIGEARYMFCYDRGIVPGTLLDAGYYQDPVNHVMPPDYVQGNVIRNKLQACAQQSLTDPWKPGPSPADHTCKFETMAGPNGPQIWGQVDGWIQGQWQVGAEAPQQGLCIAVKSSQDLRNISGDIKVAAYSCN